MNPLVSTEPHAAHHAGRTALSVNVNKVALLRNTRHLGIPSVVKAATLCLQAGADGITVHPRPDERHIRAHDVYDLAALTQQWPQAEYNIEGNPFHNLMGFARELVAKGLPLHQMTFVPDSERQFTSDHGWDLAADGERLRPLIAECRALGVRVSLFMDPQPQAMALARSVGASRVELYTEPYAAAHAASLNGAGGADLAAQLAAFSATAQAALAAGLGVNAGHDLNRDNLADFLRAVPGVQEVSIGHALVADALELGLTETVRDYQRCIRAAHAPVAAAT
jgi:pyridoxine 5-phosphate synthase